MKTYFRKFFIVTLVFLWSSIPFVSFASDVFFVADKNTFAIGEDFVVKVFLDTKNVSINAVEGVVIIANFVFCNCILN